MTPEQAVTAFAKGIMLGALEAQAQPAAPVRPARPAAKRRRLRRNAAPPATTPQQQELPNLDAPMGNKETIAPTVTGPMTADDVEFMEAVLDGRIPPEEVAKMEAALAGQIPPGHYDPDEPEAKPWMTAAASN